jgi:hypothetical protein
MELRLLFAGHAQIALAAIIWEVIAISASFDKILIANVVKKLYFECAIVRGDPPVKIVMQGKNSGCPC